MADGEAHTVEVFRDGDAVWLRGGGAEPVRFSRPLATDAAAGAVGGGSLEAPMPGVVIEVRAEPGAVVAEGDVLVVLESMKMELQVQSPRDGVVAEVAVATGDQIARGQVLVALASEEEG